MGGVSKWPQGGMTDLFPDDLPWLSTDTTFLNGVEVGAMLILCQLGAPMIKMRVHSINEDQIRVGASYSGYHVNIDKRDKDWAYLTLVAKGVPEEGPEPE
jgi:hypothetical protein